MSRVSVWNGTQEQGAASFLMFFDGVRDMSTVSSCLVEVDEVQYPIEMSPIPHPGI